MQFTKHKRKNVEAQAREFMTTQRDPSKNNRMRTS